MAIKPQKALGSTDTGRGIQNAVSRFKTQRDGQLLSSELLAEARGGLRGEAANDAEYGDKDSNYRERSGGIRERRFLGQGDAESLQRELKKLPNGAGFGLKKDEAEDFIKRPPKKPDFPFTMLLLGVTKDLIDLGDFTGVGIIVTTIISFFVVIILLLWFLGKMSGLRRWLWKRLVFAAIISFIPVVKALPEVTILVLLAYNHENKFVEAINKTLEAIYNKGLGGEKYHRGFKI